MKFRDSILVKDILQEMRDYPDYYEKFLTGEDLWREFHEQAKYLSRETASQQLRRAYQILPWSDILEDFKRSK